MKTILIVCVLVIITNGMSHKPLESKHIIDTVNKAATTWKAGQNFGPNLSSKYAKQLVGVKLEIEKKVLESSLDIYNLNEISEYNFEELPIEFDARNKWPFCKSLHEIRDQGSCGSCWAVAAAATFTDRLCIATNGTFNGHLSAEELMTCCDTCGNCGGGLPDKAWQYFIKHGIVTGGDYGSKDGCQPYQKAPCEHGGTKGSRDKCDDDDYTQTPKCFKRCINRKYKKPFEKDHHKAKRAYYIRGVDEMKMSIYQHGPIETAYMVYEDFLSYKSGVYQHVTGELVGGHAVKIIGWGVENNTDYWLVANSWNTDWGDQGFFKIKRGTDESSFENFMVVAGEI